MQIASDQIARAQITSGQVIGRPRAAELKPPFFVDVVLLATTVGLVAISLVMIYSTTAIMAQEKYEDAFYFLRRQVLAGGLGFAALFVLSRLRIERVKALSAYLYPIVIVLLAMTLIPGLSDAAGGAHRWVKIGPMRFQPVEMVKLFFVVYMAGYFSRQEYRTAEFVSGLAKPMMLVGVVAAMLLKQPDFGSASVLILVTLSMATAAGARLRYLVAGGLACAVMLGLLVVISPYRMGRVVGFLSPWADASGKGYQLIQSLIAVGSGQVTGVGLGAGQQKLFYLPAAHTDFIFAVIGEELGFVGCLALIAMFVIFLWRGLRLAHHLVEDTFAYTLAIGLTSLIVIPAFLNMGVVIGLLPTKGLVLPLVGYGGSSLVASLCVVGLLLGLARHLWRRLA